eukprot:g4183.t1
MPHVRLARDECAGALVKAYSSGEGVGVGVGVPFTAPTVYNFLYPVTQQHKNGKMKDYYRLTVALAAANDSYTADKERAEAQEKAEARLAARVTNWVAEHALKTGEKNDRGEEAVLAVGALPPSAVRAATSSSSTLTREVGYNPIRTTLPPSIGIALGSQFVVSAVKSKSVRHGTRVDTALSFPFDDVAAVCLRFADTNFGTADRLGQMQAWAWEFGRRYILQTSGAGRVLLWRDMPNRDRLFALLLTAAFAAESRALAEGRSHDIQSPSASSLAAAVARLAGGSLQMQQEGGGLMLLKKSLFLAFQLAGSTTTSGAEVQTGAGEQGEEDRLGAVVGRLQRLFFAADSVPNRICRDKMEQGKATSGNGKATYFLTERDLRAGATTPKESLRKMVAIQYLTAAFRRKYALTRMRVLEVDGHAHGQGQDVGETTIVWELVPPAHISLAGRLGQGPPPQGHEPQQARGTGPTAALLEARLYMTRATFHLLFLLLLNDVVPNALANANQAAQGIDVRALLSEVSAHLTSDRSGDVESHGNKNAIFTLHSRAAESVTRSRGLDFEDYLAGHNSNTREEVDHEFVDDEVVEDESSTSRPLSSTLLDASVAAHPAVKYALQAYFSSLRLWSTSGPPVLRRCNVRMDMFGSAVSGFGTEKSDFDFSFTPELPNTGKHVNACYLNVISDFYRNARNPAAKTKVLMKWQSIEIDYAPQNEFVLGEGTVLVRRELLDMVERDVGLVDVSGVDDEEDSWVSFKVDLTVNNFAPEQAQKLHDIQHLAASDATVRNVGRVFFLDAKQRGLVGTSWKANYSVMPSFRFLLVYVQFLVDAGLYKEEQELPQECALWTRDPWLHPADRGNYKSIDPMKRLKPELTRNRVVVFFYRTGVDYGGRSCSVIYGSWCYTAEVRTSGAQA